MGCLPGCVRVRAVTLHRTKCPCEAVLQTLSRVEGHDASTTWHQIYETLECNLDRFQIFIDVRVIEFHRGQDYAVREIVQELRAFIEKRGIVFVAFDYEVFPFSYLKAAAEIFRDSADQK